MTQDSRVAHPPTPRPPPPEFEQNGRALGIDFEPGDIERLGRFLGLLFEANKVTNLTAITEPEQAWTKHILDALTIVPVLASLQLPPEDTKVPAPPTTNAVAPYRLRVADVGSGGGVPALPLAIVMPDVHFTLIEATGKKADFLESAVGALGLKNAQVLRERAERIGQDHKLHREKYDAAMARALGHLAIVVELCGPLVRPHGVVVAVKGAKAEEELAETGGALGLVGLRHVETVTTPTGKLVLLEKTARTPRLYPRRDGEPSRVPLGVARGKK